MNGKTYAYLDIAAVPPVGEALLDPRPAFVFRSDGSGLLWANAAGVAFFGETGMSALLERNERVIGACENDVRAGQLLLNNFAETKGYVQTKILFH